MQGVKSLVKFRFVVAVVTIIGTLGAAPGSVNVPDGFTFAAVGDLLQVSPLMPLQNADFLAVDKIIKDANVAFGNGEMPLIDISSSRIYPAAENGGTNAYGLPSVARDLKVQGFTMVSRANNHSTDWNVSGMEMTDALFDAAGIMHAGTGRDEAAARATRFVDTPWGRIGLASTTSTFEGNEPAGEPAGDVAARPGASVLRTDQALIVDRNTLNGLKRYYGADTYRDTDKVTSDAITVEGQPYVVGSGPGIHYTMDKRDLAQILRGVRQGSAVSNLLVFSIHCHESASGVVNDVPQGDFLRDFAHQVIDAGADVFVGHGPHQVGAIEIYKGKPIFYSLGNYIFQLSAQENIYPEGWRAVGLDSNRSIDEAYWEKFLGHYFKEAKWWQSVVVTMTYRHNAVETIRLYPIDLGRDKPAYLRGVPALAPREEAEAILKHIEALSAPYHTRIDIENGVGVIHVGA